MILFNLYIGIKKKVSVSDVISQSQIYNIIYRVIKNIMYRKNGD